MESPFVSTIRARKTLQQGHLLAPGVVGVVARHFVGERIQTRKRGAKNHSRVVAQSVGQGPAVGQLRAFCRGFVALHQWNAGVAQGVEANGNGELSVAVEGGNALGGDAELFLQIECAAAACQLDDVRDITDRLERAAVVVLHQARNVFVHHSAAKADGDGVNELIAAQDAADVAIIKDVLGAGQA